MRILSIDPGDSTGFVVAEVEGKFCVLLDMGVWKYNEVYQRLCEHRTADVFVVENYLIRPKQNAGGYEHNWAKPTPLRIIGACEFIAANFPVKLVMQEPAIKPVGAGYLGLASQPKKGMHHMDAMVHLQYYLVVQLGHKPTAARKKT